MIKQPAGQLVLNRGKNRDVVCKMCKKDLFQGYSVVGFETKKFCSKECAKMWKVRK